VELLTYDVLSNCAVLLAALGFFGTGTFWPDVTVAIVMAALAVQGGWIVVRHASSELKSAVSSLG
jgi:Co/Zn/Cd efflux system component